MDIIDIEMLEKAGLNAQYPSEMSAKNGFIVVLGRQVDKLTIQTDPLKTKLWHGNPRNFSTNVVVDDLLPQIKAAGTNTVPVYGRYANDAKGQYVEVIAGSRRRLAAEQLSLPLTVDIVDINDDEAYFLAEMENNGRKDLDFIGSYRYLKSRFDTLKHSVGINVGKFAEKHHMQRQHMSEIINIAELPDALLDCVNDPYTWTHRKLKSLKQIFGQAKKQNNETQFLDLCQTQTFETASALMIALSKITPGSTKSVTTNFVVVDGIEIKIKQNSTGGRSINIPAKLSEEKFKLITQFIEAMKN